VTRAIEQNPGIEYGFLLTDIVGGELHFYLFNRGGDDRVEGVYRLDDEQPFTGARAPE